MSSSSAVDLRASPAAVASAKSGAETLLVEAGPMLGGDLLSGLPIDGAVNARGEWIIGGINRELFDACDALGGYVGPICDWRLMYGVCIECGWDDVRQVPEQDLRQALKAQGAVIDGTH